MGDDNSHSRLAPSAAERWTTCTASVAYCAKHKLRSEDTKYSKDGTVQHEWNHKLCTRQVEADDIPELNREYAEFWRDVCAELVTPESTAFYETQVPLFYQERDTGTVDFASISADAVHIRDYKHGEGVMVDPEYNPQLLIYAWSFLEQMRPMYSFAEGMRVTIGIVQPRYRGEEPVRVWETTVAEIREWTHDIVKTVNDINTDNVVFAPSVEACRWCPAAKQMPLCPERMDRLKLLPPQSNPLECFKDLDQRPVLTVDQLVNIYRNEKILKQIIDNAKVVLTDMLRSGRTVPGVKLVRGRQGNREWTDEGRVRELMRYLKLRQRDYIDEKIKSPAQIEKIPAVIEQNKSTKFKNIFAGLQRRSEGKITIALESDKRPPVDHSLGFDDLDSLSEGEE